MNLRIKLLAPSISTPAKLRKKKNSKSAKYQNRIPKRIGETQNSLCGIRSDSMQKQTSGEYNLEEFRFEISCRLWRRWRLEIYDTICSLSSHISLPHPAVKFWRGHWLDFFYDNFHNWMIQISRSKNFARPFKNIQKRNLNYLIVEII